MDYRSPGSVKEAVDLLAAHAGRAHVLAGGTDLLVKLRAGFVAPELVVDVKAIPQLRGIQSDARGFRIGAATSCAEIGEHAALAAAWPGVVEALQLIGSTQIQGRATLGRQSVQRFAGRRQRAGPDRGGRRLRGGGARRRARGAGREDRHRSGADCAGAR